MPAIKKRQPKLRKMKPAPDPLLLTSRILIDFTALVLLYLLLHLHWKLF